MAVSPEIPQRLYLGINVGTTGAIAIDGTGIKRGTGHARCALRSLAPGQYVQNAADRLTALCDGVHSACARVEPSDIASLAVSAQGGALVPIDSRLHPIAPARSWLDRRPSASAETFTLLSGAHDFYRRTGCPIAPNNLYAAQRQSATGPQEPR